MSTSAPRLSSGAGHRSRRASRHRPARAVADVLDWLTSAREQYPPEVRGRLIASIIDSRLTLLVGTLSIGATTLAVAYLTGALWPWLWLGADIAVALLRLFILHDADRHPNRDPRVLQSRMIASGIAWFGVFATGCFLCVHSGNPAVVVLAAVNTVAVASVSMMQVAALPRYGVLIVTVCYVPFGLALATSGEPGYLVVALLVPLWMAGLFGLLAQNHQLTLRVIRAELQTRRIALTDKLTGLPNRLYLEERLQGMCHGLERGERFALLGLDLDGFKAVNDRHGHGAGDLLLQALAGRLRGAVREQDSACRLGGDEFVVLLPAASADEAAFVAKRIIAAISRPFDVGVVDLLQVGVSIGSAAAPEHGAGPAELLAAADRALYAAKAAGKGTHRAFVSEAGPSALTALSA
jgi:diguanylate cyclase (GGDEF)-like protein